MSLCSALPKSKLPSLHPTPAHTPIHASTHPSTHPSTHQASEYDIPIYITETGIADKSDANRSYMIDQYMQAVRWFGRGGCLGGWG